MLPYGRSRSAGPPSELIRNRKTFYMAATDIESQHISHTKKTDGISEHKKVTRAAGVVGFWTTMSRILGFIRDMVTALFLGAGVGADAFFVAFRIPNLLRRLTAEGAFSAAFVPTFVDTLETGGHEDAQRLANTVTTLMIIVLAVISVLGIVFSEKIVLLIASGYYQDPEKLSLTVSLNRIVFPYILFISLVALASGILNSMGHFAAPAAAPVILNLCMISSVAVGGMYFGTEPSYALAWGVVAAGILQLVLQLPFLRMQRLRFRPNFDFKNPALRRMGRLFVPAALAGSVYQLNIFIGTQLASWLPSGSIAWLYYADRLVELPLGVFAIALGTAVLPSMSRQVSSGDIDGLKKTVSYSLRLIGFFTIPASVALIILRVPIIAILFQRGRFTIEDTTATAYALLWYTAGLWAYSGLKVVNQAFFSLKDTKTPLYVSIGSLVVNLVAGYSLMWPMGHAGLAVATSLAAAYNLIVLCWFLSPRIHGLPVREIFTSFARIGAASAMMGLFLFYTCNLADWTHGLTFDAGFALIISVCGGLLVFLATAYLFRSPELRSMISMVRGGTAYKA